MAAFHMMTTILVMLVCFSSVVRADGSVDEGSIAAMVKAMVEEQVAKQNEEIAKQKETIAALTAALEAKTDIQKHFVLSTGGDTVELVSAADVKALEKRVEACEKKNEAQDAKIGMTVTTVHKKPAKHRDGRAGAPPAPPPTIPPPLPPPSPVAMPGRRLQSTSDGNYVNEVSITGPISVVSWNSHTPGLTSFNCTGVGDGTLTCSGDLRAQDFFTHDGRSLLSELNTVKQFVGMLPPPPTVVELLNETQLNGSVVELLNETQLNGSTNNSA